MECALAQVGAVPQRAAVGNGARGLQPGRQCVELLPARSRAFAHVSLGRRRPCRFQRPEAAPVLRAGAVERERCDPEGAVVRADQRRGQSRRGRQGVLLLSGLHADPLIHEVALQVSARGVPVRRPDSTELAALAARLRVRADRYRRLRRRPLLRRGRRIRQVVRGGMLRADHGDQPWARAGAASPAADAVVPQHLDLVARQGQAAPRRRARPERYEPGGSVTS